MALKYKVGDRVRIKSLDWYNKNKDELGQIDTDYTIFIPRMAEYCGKEATIFSVEIDNYVLEGIPYTWTDEMIDCLVERNGKTYPYKIGDRVVLKGNNRCATITDLKYNSFGNLSYYIRIDNDKDISVDCPTDLLLPYDNKIEGLVEEEEIEFTKEDKYCCDIMSETDPTTYVLPQGYQFVDENGNVINATKIVLEKKKKEYPKTYEECAKVLLDRASVRNDFGYKGELLVALQKLLVCRDAYWKIAGEEMGLGKPWEPDGNSVYAITRNDGCIVCIETGGNDEAFEFPTEEMRDAFKENFAPDIEICKEFL